MYHACCNAINSVSVMVSSVYTWVLFTHLEQVLFCRLLGLATTCLVPASPMGSALGCLAL